MTSEIPPISQETNENSVSKPSENTPSSPTSPMVSENLTPTETWERPLKRTLLGDKDKRQQNPNLFKPGQVVPGGGRPKGSKNKITLLQLSLEEYLREEASDHMGDVLHKAISMAKRGHPGMIKLLLELHMSKNVHADDRSVDDKITININQIEPIKSIKPESPVIEGEKAEEDNNDGS